VRRPLLLLLILAVCGSAALLIFHFISSRPSPTRVGWTATVSTLAGDGAPGWRDGATPNQTAFSDPFGVAVDDTGAVYVSDAANSNRIRKIDTDGGVVTVAGGNDGFADGQGTQAAFNTPSGIALDSSGNLYVADTGNNRIRKITPAGQVTTLAGDGTAGYSDGPAMQARFNGPIGLAVDHNGNVFVADTYNDRIRKISTEGRVTSIAGAGHPGYADGTAATSLFDTPCGVAVTPDGTLFIADTGNSQVRKLSPDGQVTTLKPVFPNALAAPDLRQPVGLALTHDGFVYITELDRGRVVQLAPDGTAQVITSSHNAADPVAVRLHQPGGIAVGRNGELYLADSGNYLVRKLSNSASEGPSGNSASASSQAGNLSASNEPLPRLTKETLGLQSLEWPLEPQQHPHEVVATIGEVRGRFNSTDSRDHLHSGLDVFGAYGDTVRAIRAEKVTSPVSNWAFADLNEGVRIGVVSYIHLQVGRDKDGQLFADSRFIPVYGDDGKLMRIRLRRGTLFRPGEALGTINRMYHVHLNVGPPGAETNPLTLAPVGFVDTIAPTIEKDGIQLFTEDGKRLSEKADGRLLVRGRIRIVVDAFDRTNLNSERRRLGLYRVGYQVLKADGAPASGYEQARINLLFNRLPADSDAVKLAYAEQSGITVYGSATTRFLYEVTNVVRDGIATEGRWNASELPGGDYILRIIAADFSGNEAQEGRDLPIRVH